MGQHKGSALAANDWGLYICDGLDDLLLSWDCYADMANGASEADRQQAKKAYVAMWQEWDGTMPSNEEQEAFADRYDALLRETARVKQHERTNPEDLS